MTWESSGHRNVKFGRVAEKKKKREKQLIVICDQYLSNRIPCNYYRVLSRASKYKSRYESRAFLFTARSKYHRPQTPPSKQMQHTELSWYAAYLFRSWSQQPTATVKGPYFNRLMASDKAITIWWHTHTGKEKRKKNVYLRTLVCNFLSSFIYTLVFLAGSVDTRLQPVIFFFFNLKKFTYRPIYILLLGDVNTWLKRTNHQIM